MLWRINLFEAHKDVVESRFPLTVFLLENEKVQNSIEGRQKQLKPPCLRIFNNSETALGWLVVRFPGEWET
jgi:hypothetical protein